MSEPNCHLAQMSSQMAIRPYTSHSAIHTQIQMQTESEAFKTH